MLFVCVLACVCVCERQEVRAKERNRQRESCMASPSQGGRVIQLRKQEDVGGERVGEG